MAQVITEGYAPDLNDIEIESLGRDPFLVAAALGGFERIAVSREVSARSKRRHNRKVPDVCRAFSILCINKLKLRRAATR